MPIIPFLEALGHNGWRILVFQDPKREIIGFQQGVSLVIFGFRKGFLKGFEKGVSLGPANKDPCKMSPSLGSLSFPSLASLDPYDSLLGIPRLPIIPFLESLGPYWNY